MFKNKGNNVTVPMTRRYPKLKKKQKKRDSKIAGKLIHAWDVEGNKAKQLQIFLDNKDKLSPERYWELLRSVWIVCGSVESARVFRELFLSDKRSRHFFSTPEEHEILRDLPDRFQVFRAADDEHDGGLSWTLSKEYAENYKAMYGKKQVFKRWVDKCDVFAYINRNKEDELIIL